MPDFEMTTINELILNSLTVNLSMKVELKYWHGSSPPRPTFSIPGIDFYHRKCPLPGFVSISYRVMENIEG